MGKRYMLRRTLRTKMESQGWSYVHVTGRPTRMLFARKDNNSRSRTVHVYVNLQGEIIEAAIMQRGRGVAGRNTLHSVMTWRAE